MQLQKLRREDLPRLLPYFRTAATRISAYSAGAQFIWHAYIGTRFAEEAGCLCLCECYRGDCYFYYPLAGENGDAEAALAAIEKHCRDEEVMLRFSNIPREQFPALALRYGADLRVTDPRRWRDYLYEPENFRSYPGGAFSGQRNHVNKFHKENPDAAFSRLTDADLPDVRAFLHAFDAERANRGEKFADEEMRGALSLVNHVAELGMCCGVLRAGGKVVGLSVGERCGDTLVIHVEKASRGVAGAYPALAQAFAREFAGDAKYINREDDSGELGMRKSKLQYRPAALCSKYNLAAHRAIDNLHRIPEIRSERLVLRAVGDEDAAAYARLAGDVSLNADWGYDWREDREEEGEPPAEWFLQCARDDFDRRAELPLGVYAGDTLVGEVVLHRFGFRAEAEIGVRILPEQQGKGYAREALRRLTDYAFSELDIERMEAKCFRRNAASAKALAAAGMRTDGEDEQYFHFYKTAAM